MVSNRLIVFTLARVLLCVFAADALYFRYACKPNGDISAINPDSMMYKYAYAFNKLGNCKAEIVNNNTVIKVTECPKGEDAEVVNIILNTKSRPFFLIGGKDHKTVSASCSLEKNSYLDRVQISMSAQGLFRDIFGFPPNFYQRPPNVTIEMYDVTGEPGYDVFTISYPIGVAITGPPESDIFPEVCTAYSSREVGKGLSAVILKNGCAMEHRLMFSFSTEEANWFDRGIDIDDDFTRFVLDGGFHDVTVNGDEEELPPPPRVFTNTYAFRFYLSNYLSIHCEVRICPSGSNSCKLPCDSVDPTVPPQVTVSLDVASSTEPEVEPEPEPEVNNTVTSTSQSSNVVTSTQGTTSSPVTSKATQTTPNVIQNTITLSTQGSAGTTKASLVTDQSTTIPVVVNKGSSTPQVYMNGGVSTDLVTKGASTTAKPSGLFGRRKRDASGHVKAVNGLNILSFRKRRSINDNKFILGKDSIRKQNLLMNVIIVGPDAILKQLDEMDDHLKVSNEMVGSELHIDGNDATGGSSLEDDTLVSTGEEPIDVTGHQDDDDDNDEQTINGDDAPSASSLEADKTPVDGAKSSVGVVKYQDDDRQATEISKTKLSSNNDLDDAAVDDESSHPDIMNTLEEEKPGSDQVVLDNAVQPIFGVPTKKDFEKDDDLYLAGEVKQDTPEANENGNQIISVQATIQVKNRKEDTVPVAVSQ